MKNKAVIKKIITFVFLIILPLFFVCLLFYNFVDKSIAQSSDAIAIRVIPNPEHISALRWYKERGFTGSPQSMLVDGYEAIRDGRTVYVNAANIDDSDNLYTNIYLISYNQEAERNTTDIFGKMLSSWKFNVNKMEPGICSQTVDKSCILDSDCPVGEYCLSIKAKIVRDTKRLSDLADVIDRIEEHKNALGYYPKLNAGSYLPQRTLSTWPSWQKVLAQSLGGSLPVDPINKLGDCSEERFNTVTCWDEGVKEFDDQDASNNILDLPENSNVYVYTGEANGLGYDVCAVMESEYVIEAIAGACSLSEAVVVTHVDLNISPEFTSINLPIGQIDEPYEGFIEAYDRNGDNILWTPHDWTVDGINFELQDIESLPNKKRIYSSQAGSEGGHDFSLTIHDGRGGIVTQTFTINIGNQPPEIISQDFSYVASSTNPFNFSIVVSDHTSSYDLTASLADNNMPPGFPTPSFDFVDAENFYIFHIDKADNVYLTPDSVAQTADYTSTLRVVDVFGAENEKDFTIKVINNAPSVRTYDTRQIVGEPLTPLRFKISDPEYNECTYNISGLPTGITSSIDPDDENRIIISGTYSQNTPQDVSFNCAVAVTDYYGASANNNFRITIANNKPYIDTIRCAKAAWINNDYSCSITATDPDRHDIVAINIVGLPVGISSNGQGNISGVTSDIGDYNITIQAIDEYGAESVVESFVLSVKNDCYDMDGDGYGVCPDCGIVKGCAEDGNDCYDIPEGQDRLFGTLDDGENINPGEPDDCTQYDGIDNDCDGEVDNHAMVYSQLTNIDFEDGPVGGFPAYWNGSAQSRGEVGITQAEARSGYQSVLLHQDGNLDYPGNCSQELCESLPNCTWLAASSQCQMSGPDTCHPTPPYIYNAGETLCWGNTNRVMWGTLYYDVSHLPFNVGETYLVRFYYKGHINIRTSPTFAYNLGSASQSWPIASYPWWDCNTYYCPGGSCYSGICADRPDYCCYHALSAANQRRPYPGAPFSKIEPNNYNEWTLYSDSFEYTDALSLLLRDDGTKQHWIGTSLGYTSTPPEGNDLYVDDFELLRCVNEVDFVSMIPCEFGSLSSTFDNCYIF